MNNFKNHHLNDSAIHVFKIYKWYINEHTDYYTIRRRIVIILVKLGRINVELQ